MRMIARTQHAQRNTKTIEGMTMPTPIPNRTPTQPLEGLAEWLELTASMFSDDHPHRSRYLQWARDVRASRASTQTAQISEHRSSDCLRTAFHFIDDAYRQCVTDDQLREKHKQAADDLLAILHARGEELYPPHMDSTKSQSYA